MFRTTGRALLGAALSGAVLAVGLAGTASAKTAVTKVEINDDGCPAKVTVKAGPNNFKVTNSGSGDVSEFEILSGDRILGEVENVAPGLNKEFSLTLKTGNYTTYCPGGSTRQGQAGREGHAPTRSSRPTARPRSTSTASTSRRRPPSS